MLLSWQPTVLTACWLVFDNGTELFDQVQFKIMFEKTRSLLLRSTASARSHNLAVVFWQGHFRAAVIHKATVNIVIWSESGGIHKTYELHCKDNAGSRNDVYQVKVIIIHDLIRVHLFLINISVIGDAYDTDLFY